jgi:hypothetical protein
LKQRVVFCGKCDATGASGSRLSSSAGGGVAQSTQGRAFDEVDAPRLGEPTHQSAQPCGEGHAEAGAWSDPHECEPCRKL